MTIAHDPSPSYPSTVRAWAFVGVLFVASIASVIDRAILNFVVDPVKADIGLSDVQIALLQGLAFGLFYAAVGLALGLSADRYSRLGLILVAMSLWCCATVAAGFTHSFGAFFATRLLVGLGEAALGPAAISLIGDLFPADRRGRPISVFLMGQALAIGLSISISGSLLSAAHAGRFSGISLLAPLAPWRIVFVCCGAAGAVVLVLLCTMREPARQQAPQRQSVCSQALYCMRYMQRNREIFLPFYLGFACVFAAAYGAGAWMPTMLLRNFGATTTQLAQWLGPLSLLFGILGPLLGGLIADHHARSGRFPATLGALGLVPLFAIPSVCAVLAPDLRPAILLVAATSGVTAMVGTLTFAALQSMVPGDMRGIAVSLTGLLNTVLGATLGPLLVATFTEHLYGGPALVGYAIATVAVPALLLGALCFVRASRALQRQRRSGGEIALLLQKPVTGALGAT